jgi:hypothetical protein
MSLLLDILISRVILSPIFIPSSSNSVAFILKTVESRDDLSSLLLSLRNAPSIASDIFFGKSFKSSNEVRVLLLLLFQNDFLEILLVF